MWLTVKLRHKSSYLLTYVLKNSGLGLGSQVLVLVLGLGFERKVIDDITVAMLNNELENGEWNN